MPRGGMRPGLSFKGRRHTDEAKQKISIAMRNNKRRVTRWYIKTKTKKPKKSKNNNTNTSNNPKQVQGIPYTNGFINVIAKSNKMIADLESWGFWQGQTSREKKKEYQDIIDS